MCGIVAIVGRSVADCAPIHSMTATIAHRGPDDDGFAILPQDGVALGMRRLSILDIAGGAQPMWDETQRHVVVFNGEIYNFAPLRAELLALGHTFVSDHSDTETIVHGFEAWGNDLFPRLNGMFAIAIWDGSQRRLTAARDRCRREALVRRPTANRLGHCLRVEGHLRTPGVRSPGGSGRARTVPGVRLHAESSDDPRWCSEAASRSRRGDRTGLFCLEAILVTRVQAAPNVDSGRRRSARRTPRSIRPTANGRRRPGRPVPERRTRLQHGRLLHGAGQLRHAVVLDRLRGPTLRRVGLCEPGGSPSWRRTPPRGLLRGPRSRIWSRGSPSCSTNRWATSRSSRPTC